MTNLQATESELIKLIQSSSSPRDVLKNAVYADLYKQLKASPTAQKAELGKSINQLKKKVLQAIDNRELELQTDQVEAIDVTAPQDINFPIPTLLPAQFGSRHPLTIELERVIDIYTRMGFKAIESRQIDDDYNMFTALNFPDNHPARDSYDTFRTSDGFIPPAHTSTMQNRILREGKVDLEAGGKIAVISYGRVFRNEDVDNTHGHTFHQVEGVFVSRKASLGELLGTLTTFFEVYYDQKLKIKTQPGFFPFTEPSLEFAIEKPVELGGKPGEWLEMTGCGMIHPNVLRNAGIDPKKYRGFAWGGGVERLVMLRYGIEDLRYFQSGKLEFLRQFS